MTSRRPATPLPLIMLAGIMIPALACSVFQPSNPTSEGSTPLPEVSPTPHPALTESALPLPSPTDTKESTPLPSATKTFAVLDLTFSPLFAEDFEDYPLGVLGDAPNTLWIRKEIGRVGNVTKYWVHSGSHNLQVNSFVYNTEIDYVPLDLDEKPAQLNLSLWYTPDGYFIYTDFAEFGLGYVQFKFQMDEKFGIFVEGHDVLISKGISGDELLFNELEFGRGPADMGQGTPKHNYFRLECDFVNNVLRVYIGTGADAPLRATRSFDGRQEINAFYIKGGLNPTYFDDILIEAGN